jgi:hypothetical protein
MVGERRRLGHGGGPLHAKVPGRGGGPGHAGGRDPAEGRATPESRGAAAAWGALELGRASSWLMGYTGGLVLSRGWVWCWGGEI